MTTCDAGACDAGVKHAMLVSGNAMLVSGNISAHAMLEHAMLEHAMLEHAMLVSGNISAQWPDRLPGTVSQKWYSPLVSASPAFVQDAPGNDVVPDGVPRAAGIFVGHVGGELFEAVHEKGVAGSMFTLRKQGS